MDAAMYIFLNKGAGMSTGKAAAQAGHAAVEAFRLSARSASLPSRQLDLDRPILREWYKGGHYKKLVMEAANEAQLYTIQQYLRARGFDCELIIDEGLTEIQPFTVTALGVEIVDKDDDHVAATFGSFKLYKDDPTQEELKRQFQEQFMGSGSISQKPNPFERFVNLWRS